MKKNLIVLQEGGKDCGAASLLSIIRYYGGDINLERLIDMTKTTKEGTNFYNIAQASLSLGLTSSAYKVNDVSKLKDLNSPIIVQLTNNSYHHFVVVYKMSDNKVLIMDPAKGKVVLDLFDFSSQWTGYILVFEKEKELPIFASTKKINKLILNTLFKNKKIILSTLILSIIFTLTTCLVSFYTQIIFDKVIDTDIENLLIVTIVFLSIYILKNITNYTRNYLIIHINQKIDISIFLSTFSKIIILPFTYYKNKTTGEVLSRLQDLSMIKTFISKIIINLCLDILIFTTTFIIISIIHKPLIYIIIIDLIIYSILIILFIPIIDTRNKIIQDSTSIINSNLIENISSFETIKNLHTEENTIFKFSMLYNKKITSINNLEKITNVFMFLKELLIDISFLIISYILIKSIMKGKITMGNYITISYLISYIFSPLNSFIETINSYCYIKNSIKRANNLLEVETEKFDNNDKLQLSGNILVKDLTYTYDNKRYVLNNLNIYIKEREKILILGPSGHGKSTLLKIFYKYLNVERDKVLINNYDINDYSLSDIRNKITYISQNELLYTDTIRNNILANREVKEEEYLNICRMLYVDEIVKEKSLGYDYMLEENGNNISGGQKQRIILARGLLKKGQIIMIDEGLSQIDINLENKILKNIFYYYYDKTILIVSHRKSNLDLFDRVITIDSDTNMQKGNI